MFQWIALCAIVTNTRGHLENRLTISGQFLSHMSMIDEPHCTHANVDIGLIFVEAMIYTIDKINDIPNYFPLGYKIDYVIGDLCNERKSIYEHIIVEKASIAIGAYSSESTEFWSKFLWVWNKPLVSYGASSTKFENRKKFNSLFNAVPSDYLSSMAMIELCKRYNWQYVAIVHTNSEDGNSLTYEFENLMKLNGICLAGVIDISKDSTPDEVHYAVRDLLTIQNVRTVFLFLSYEGCHYFFSAIDRFIERLKKYQFVVGTPCGTMLEIDPTLRPYFSGLITLQLANPFPGHFEEYFRELTPTRKKGSVNEKEFNEYWQILHNCSLVDPNTTDECTHKNNTGYNRFTPVRPVIRAVEAAANALREYLLNNCDTNCKNCSCRTSNMRNLHEYLQSATDSYGDYIFTENGNTFDSFDIFQYQRNSDDNSTFEFAKVGIWNMTKFFETEGDRGLIIDDGLVLPVEKSVCSLPCPINQIKVNVSDCCWECRYCHKTKEYVSNNICMRCPLGHKATQLQTTCYPLPVTNITNSKSVVYLVMSISILAIICSFIILLVYVRHRETTIIKASSFPLALCSLIGLILMFVTAILFVQAPTDLLCGVQKVTFGVSLTLCYAPLVLKTNRVYRIFVSSGKFKLRSLLLVSMKSQFLLIAGMVGIQLVMAVLWIINDIPTVHVVYIEDSGTRTCYTTRESVTLNSIFPAVLMLSSAFWAFKTRNLPETYTEIKSIGITIYLTLFVGTISLALTMLLDATNFIGTYIFCFTMQTAAIITLIGQYTMKIIILYCKQQLNFDSKNHVQEFAATMSCPTSPTTQRGNNGFKNEAKVNSVVIENEFKKTLPVENEE